MSEEAIGALETAARSPRYRFEAAALLARLHRDQRIFRVPSNGSSARRKRRHPMRRPDGSCCTTSGRRSKRRVRPRGRWRYSSNCRRTPETTATSLPESIVWAGSRPEADHQNGQPSPVRCIFSRGGIHSRGCAMVCVLGAQSFRGHPRDDRGAHQQPVRSWGGERGGRHHGNSGAVGASVRHPGAKAGARRSASGPTVTFRLDHRPVICCVTDRTRLPDPSAAGLIAHIRAVVSAGVGLVQIRGATWPIVS